MRFRLASTLAVTLLVWPHIAAGSPQDPQPADAPAPAHVAYVEGTATLERDGRPENNPLNMPLLSGDRLKTGDGRVEVLFADGSALHMDSRTTIDLQADDLLRLIDGRLRLSIAGSGEARSAPLVYRVDSPAGSVRITQPGEYRIAMLRRGEEVQLELAVLRGAGELFTDEGTTPVRAGERAYASAGLAPSYAYTYNSANWDAFDRWSESRRDTRLGVSAQYLPSEVRAYASTFDEDGDWRYSQPHGYVWYPRVDVSWRPYYYGRWARYPRLGWTWIGADRFAWPTHHYGRWGFSAGAWFWIPARHWAPAHVSWAYAPGYVSWCPLGFDNRPVIAINIFNVRPGYYSSWRAWTAVGYSHFGRDYVHRRAVDWNRFDGARRPSFRVAQSAPAGRDIAVPRSTPINRAGARGLPAEAGSHTSPTNRTNTRPTNRTNTRPTNRTNTRPTNRTNTWPTNRTNTWPTNRTNTWLPPSGGSSGERTRVSDGSSDAPRYINRGDAIVRSRTGRPSAPAERTADYGTAVPRAPSTAEGRTAPIGPARRSDPLVTPSAPATEMQRARPVPDTGFGSRPAPDTGPGFAPRSPYERGRVMPRADAPVYQPPARTAPDYERRAVARPSIRAEGAPSNAEGRPSTGAQGAPSNAEGRSRAPEMSVPNRESRGPAAPDAGPRDYARPPGGRSMPAPRAGVPERSAPSGDRAVPRGTRPSGRGGA